MLCAPTAFGKTVLGGALIARRSVNTLILVHRQQLIDQWKERLQTFLDLDPKNIGQIGAGKKKATGIVDIATIQSLVRQGEVSDIVTDYGHVIVDECHHVSAFSFEKVLRGCKAKYVLGLTATPKRKDGHHPIIFMQCGQLLNAGKGTSALEESGVDRSVIVRKTGFIIPIEVEKTDIHELYNSLSNNDVRNRMIVTDVESAVRKGRCPLVLTERVAHLCTRQKSHNFS